MRVVLFGHRAAICTLALPFAAWGAGVEGFQAAVLPADSDGLGMDRRVRDGDRRRGCPRARRRGRERQGEGQPGQHCQPAPDNTSHPVPLSNR